MGIQVLPVATGWKVVQRRLQEQCWWWDLSSAGCSSLPGRNRNSGSSFNMCKGFISFEGEDWMQTALFDSAGTVSAIPSAVLEGLYPKKGH